MGSKDRKTSVIRENIEEIARWFMGHGPTKHAPIGGIWPD
jgi:hypothetical protein